MDNYYEECISKVEALIEDKKFDQAKTILEDELDMPYVPNDYLQVFKELYRLIPKGNSNNKLYLDSMEEIENSLFLDEEQQLQAMLSLERLNLRPHLSELRSWLESGEIETWIKQQILVFLLEQGIAEKFRVNLEGELTEVNTDTLSHPFKNENYLNQVRILKSELEQKNPSFYQLCMQELNYQVGNLFPFKHETVDGQNVIKLVESYLNTK